jgi:hypothetical protein
MPVEEMEFGFMNVNDLQKDGNGDVITKPLTAWFMTTAFQIGVLLAVQYVETPQELESTDRHQIQFVLTPRQCLELADRLTKVANRVLDPTGQAPN